MLHRTTSCGSGFSLRERAAGEGRRVERGGGGGHTSCEPSFLSGASVSGKLGGERRERRTSGVKVGVQLVQKES